MKIVAELPDFTTRFDILTYSRGAIVTSCLRYIESISTNTPLARISPCTNEKDLFFAYNRVCKVYFFYDSKNDEVTLADFIFANNGNFDD